METFIQWFLKEAKKKGMKFHHIFDYDVQTKVPHVPKLVGKPSQDVLDTTGSEELLGLVVDIIRYTFVIEFVGAVLLTVGYYQEGFEIGQSIYFGFCKEV